MEEQKKGNLKELWKNDKSRSLMMLSFYFVFILILVVGIRTSPKTPKKEAPKKEDKEEVIKVIPFSEFNNYEYTLQIGEHLLEGKRFVEKELIQELDQIYFYEAGFFYQVEGNYKVEVDDHLYGIPLLSLRPESLSLYMTKENVFYEQSYEDGTKEVTYRIPNADFGLTEEGFVTIETKEKENVMESVMFSIKGEVIQITYHNQNGLKNLTLPNLEEKMDEEIQEEV